MQKASRTVNTFGDAAGKSGGHMEKFNVHILASRPAIGAFAGLTGQATAGLSHLVHGFMMAPGPIGVAVAGILLLTHALNEQAEAAEKARKRSEDLWESFKKQTIQSHWSPEAKKANDEMVAAGQKKIELEKEIQDLQREFDNLRGNPNIGRTDRERMQQDILNKTSEAKRAGELSNLAKKDFDKAIEKGHGGEHAHGHVQAAIGGRAAEVFKAAKDPTIAILERVANGIDRLNGRREGMMG
jgi:plasmid stabilization system protein ParE